MNIFNDDRDDSLKVRKIHSEESKVTLWSRIFKNEDNLLYSDIITKGFIWVLMFLVSLVALFIVFRDHHSNDKEVIVLNSKGSTYTDYFTQPTDNFEQKSQEKEKDLLTSSSTKEKNIKTSSNNIIKNKSQELSQTPDFSNSKDSLENLILEHTTDSERNIDSLITGTATNNTKEQHLTNIPKEVDDTKIDSIKTDKVVTSSNKVWLVTIFSGKEESKAKVKWKEIYNINPSLFVNKKPYFIKTNIENKGVYYRVSLGNVNTNDSLPYFSTYRAAINYCKYLKSNNVNCFVTESNKILLKSLKN